jgi:hypothetical protein
MPWQCGTSLHSSKPLTVHRTLKNCHRHLLFHRTICWTGKTFRHLNDFEQEKYRDSPHKLFQPKNEAELALNQAQPPDKDRCVIETVWGMKLPHPVLRTTARCARGICVMIDIMHPYVALHHVQSAEVTLAGAYTGCRVVGKWWKMHDDEIYYVERWAQSAQSTLI